MTRQYLRSGFRFSVAGVTLACAAVVLGGATHARAGAQNLSTYYIGNSLTWRINAWNVQTMAWSRGNGYEYGSHIALGKALHEIWENPNGADITISPYGQFPSALANYRWDSISLQPYSRPIEGAVGDREAMRNFIGFARVNSPNAQFYVFEQWPIKYTGFPLNFDERWVAPYTGWDDSIRTRDFYEKLVMAAREDFPQLAKPVLLVPVGDVMYELNRRMHAGLVPGFSDVEQLYLDDHHLTDVGNYMTSLTYYATLYKEDPRGLPFNPALFPDPQVAVQIQEAAWKVVSTNPLAGVGPTGVPKWIRPRLDEHALNLVPEPGAAALLVSLAGVAALRRRRRRPPR